MVSDVNHSFRIKRVIAACCSLLFCFAIAAPLGSQALKLSPSGKLAEATGSPLPDFAWNTQSLKAISKAFTSGWLDKNFPFRGLLIRTLQLEGKKA